MSEKALLCQWDARHLPWPADRVDLVVSDPPYAVMNKDEINRGKKMKPILRRIEWDEMDIYEWMGLMSGFMREMYRVCRKGATAYVFCAHEELGRLREIGQFNGWLYRMPVAVHHTNPAPKVHPYTFQSSIETCAMFTKEKGNTFNAENGGKCHNFYEFPSPNGHDRVHATQKSLDLILQLVLMSSNPGDVVCDPFLGSGVTGEACRIANRRFLGGDNNFHYVRDMASFKVFNRASAKQVADLPMFEGIV